MRGRNMQNIAKVIVSFAVLLTLLTIYRSAIFAGGDKAVENRTKLPHLVLPRRQIDLTVMIKETANAQILQHMPNEGFLGDYRSLCWEQNIGQLNCLPAIHLIGMTKCGTTDLFTKLTMHNDITSTEKEFHWWSRGRLGLVKARADLHNPAQSFESYLRRVEVPNMKDTKENRIIDASPSTIWEMIGWQEGYPWAVEPPYSLADLIHLTTPNAKIISILRNPTERLWSNYNFFDPSMIENGQGNTNSPTGRKNLTTSAQRLASAQSFHSIVIREISRFDGCLEHYSLRRCCMSDETDTSIYLNLGIYICYIQDWVEVFGENVKAISLERYKINRMETLNGIFSYLGVSVNGTGDEHVEETEKARNVNYGKGEMKPETDVILREFYRPYNVLLARYLQDTQFLFEEKPII